MIRIWEPPNIVNFQTAGRSNPPWVFANNHDDNNDNINHDQHNYYNLKNIFLCTLGELQRAQYMAMLSYFPCL